MQIIIKRKDSVTSILLFLFNVFLVNRGITSIPLKKIFKLMQPFQKNETAIRMGLSREIQNGVLINRKEDGEVVYALTETALVGFKSWMKTMDLDQRKIQQQFQNWDGLWRQLLIGKDIEDKFALDSIYDLLQQSGFAGINKNLWVSPYAIPADLFTQISSFNNGAKPYVFEGHLSNERTLAELVREIWPIDRLNREYHLYLDSFNYEVNQHNLDTYDGGGGMPFLHRFGLDFFEIVRNDPHLPLDLLPPDWAGVQAAKAFKTIREEILPKANGFITRILEI